MGCMLPHAWLICACLRTEWSDGVAIITHVHPDGSCDLKHPNRRTRERRVTSCYIQVVPRAPSARLSGRHKSSEPRPEAAAAVPSEENNRGVAAQRRAREPSARPSAPAPPHTGAGAGQRGRLETVGQRQGLALETGFPQQLARQDAGRVNNLIRHFGCHRPIDSGTPGATFVTRVTHDQYM
jgi:hypothetical protein